MSAEDERLAREKRFTEAETRRALAENIYVREVAEVEGAEDGRYLLDVLEQLSGEVQTMIVQRGAVNVRELAMIQTKLDEAAQWALSFGRNRLASHLVIDRRRFQTEDAESATV